MWLCLLILSFTQLQAWCILKTKLRSHLIHIQSQGSSRAFSLVPFGTAVMNRVRHHLPRSSTRLWLPSHPYTLWRLWGRSAHLLDLHQCAAHSGLELATTLPLHIKCWGVPLCPASHKPFLNGPFLEFHVIYPFSKFPNHESRKKETICQFTNIFNQ